MQAKTYLEEKIKQGEEILLDMYIEEMGDLCLVPELDQNKICYTLSRKPTLQPYPPLLLLTVEEGVFHYALDDSYKVKISKRSALKILRHAFQLEGYQEN